MPDDLFRVFTGGVSISKQLEMSERQNLELEEERNDCQMKDGNSKGSSISSDLGVLTACQKHLPINLYTYVCGRGHVNMIHVFAANWVVKLLAAEVKHRR